MTYIDFLKLSYLTENDVTTDTFRTVITPIFIHMSLNKQEFVKVLDLHNIDKGYSMYSIDKFVNQYAIMKYVSISMAENRYSRERIAEYLDSNCDCNKFLTETINILNELNKESR